MNFETMLEFFTPDADTVTHTCEMCGKTYEVPIRQRGKRIRCTECQKEYQYRRARARLKAKVSKTTERLDDPWLDFVLAVIRQGQYDHDTEWLQAEDGARLWVRAVGVDLELDSENLFDTLT